MVVSANPIIQSYQKEIFDEISFSHLITLANCLQNFSIYSIMSLFKGLLRQAYWSSNVTDFKSKARCLYSDLTLLSETVSKLNLSKAGTRVDQKEDEIMIFHFLVKIFHIYQDKSVLGLLKKTRVPGEIANFLQMN